MSTITITDAAHDYLADLLNKQNTPGIGIRVFTVSYTHLRAHET